MEGKSKIINTEEPYTLEIDSIKVEMTYSHNEKSFRDCMVNILKQKCKF